MIAKHYGRNSASCSGRRRRRQYQKFLVHGVMSQPINVSCSVPRGYVFGPVEFITYIEDVDTFSRNTESGTTCLQTTNRRMWICLYRRLIKHGLHYNTASLTLGVGVRFVTKTAVKYWQNSTNLVWLKTDPGEGFWERLHITARDVTARLWHPQTGRRSPRLWSMAWPGYFSGFGTWGCQPTLGGPFPSPLPFPFSLLPLPLSPSFPLKLGGLCESWGVLTPPPNSPLHWGGVGNSLWLDNLTIF